MPMDPSTLADKGRSNLAPSETCTKASAGGKDGAPSSAEKAVMPTRNVSVGRRVVKPLPTSMKYPKLCRSAYDASKAE